MTDASVSPAPTRTLSEIERLTDLGVEANNAGRHAAALRIFRRILRRLDAIDPARGDDGDRADLLLLRARTWIRIATSESELNGHAAGLDALSVARGYLDAAPDRHLQFLLLSQTGYMTVRGGEVEVGLRSLEDAEDLIDTASALEAYILYLNRGTTHLFARRLARAEADLRRAYELAEVNDWPTELRMVQHNLGYLAYLKGNLAQALTAMEDDGENEEAIFRAVVLLDRSEVLIEAGLHREADQALQTALGLFRSERLWKDVGQVELARAECALLAGEFALARGLAVGARTRFRRRNNDQLRREAELLIFQAEVSTAVPHRRIAAAAVSLAGEFRAAELPSHARTATLIAAEAASQAGQVIEAADIAAAAGPIRPHDSVSVRAHTRVVRARLSAESGQLRRARREVERGLAELAHHQARFGSVDMQTAGAVHGQKLVALDIELALRAGRPKDLFDAAERGRAVTSRLSHVTAPVDDDTAELLGTLRQLVGDIRRIESEPAAAAAAEDLRRQVAQVQDQLRAKAWTIEGVDAVRPAASLAEVSGRLAEQHTTLVTVVRSGPRLCAVVVSGRGARLVALGAADDVPEWARTVRTSLDVLATGHVTEPIRRSVEGSLTRALHQFDELILRRAELEDERVVLSLAGDLTTVPWGMTPSLRGRPVVVAPSASAWLDAARPRGGHGAPSVAVFSGPDLRHAQREVAAVRGQWPDADVYERDDATGKTLSHAMQTKSVVHIAAHGHHQPENPLFSNVHMHDGPLYAYELERAGRCAEHVVLSACEVGTATVRPGDEPLGLTSVLLRLGARSVVSGVARVGDDVAADVMSAYHGRLAEGTDSAAALAMATAAVSDSPAPFVCFGSTWTAANAARNDAC